MRITNNYALYSSIVIGILLTANRWNSGSNSLTKIYTFLVCILIETINWERNSQRRAAYSTSPRSRVRQGA